MTSKFHENCVITGALDSFCLSCQKHLLHFEDLNEHIVSTKHKNALESTKYVEKYKDEFIRKIKMGYYCEVCNVMIQTLAKIGIHVSDSTHINNKSKRVLKRCNEGVVAFDNILIPKQAWHGLSEGSCTICNIDYDNEDDHINETKHIVNLIQSKLEMKKDNFIYRQFDETMISCLICNTIITIESKETHINNSEHSENYLKCKENKKNINTLEVAVKENLKENISMINNKPKTGDNTQKKDVIVQKLETSNSEDMHKVTPENTETLIQSCNKSQNVDNNDENALLTPFESLKQAKEFAKQNCMSYKRNSTYCKVCDVRISSSIKMMKEHVMEASHTEKLKNKKEKVTKNKNIDKIPMEMYIYNAIVVKTHFLSEIIISLDVVINDDICMDYLSFHMISKNANQFRCHACEVSMRRGELDFHQNTIKHKNAMNVTPVLTGYKSEFIREVRTGIYHCGFCNFIEAGLEGITNHMRSQEHNVKKASCHLQLLSHLPDIRAEREKELFLHVMSKMFR